MARNIKDKNGSGAFGAIVIMIALVAGGLLLAGCQPQGQGNPGYGGGGGKLSQGSYNEESFEPSVQLESSNFKTDDEYLAFVKANSNGGSGNAYYGGTLMAARDSMMADGASGSPAPTKASSEAAIEGGAGSGYDFSETNNQVAGVDEADTLKTDGNYIYTISGSKVFIIKAYPGEDSEVVSEIDFAKEQDDSDKKMAPGAEPAMAVDRILPYPYPYYSSNAPQGLFLQGDYLAVFGGFSDLDFFKEIGFTPRQGMTYFNIYDVSDREDPKLVKSYKFEGNYFQARMSGDYAYFVTTTGADYRRDYPTPLVIDGTSVRSIPVSDVYYFNIPYQSVSFANIHAISLKDLDTDVSSKSVAVESSQVMYMSRDNIFITYTEYINEWDIRNQIMFDEISGQFTQEDSDLVSKIKAVDDDVLSKYEKQNKILQIAYQYINYMSEKDRNGFEDRVNDLLKEKMEQYDYLEYTVINRIGVDGGEITVGANGKVPGHLNNQFSMDEEDGVLRIATTVSQRWDSWIKDEKDQQKESTNNVFTLDEDLKVLDSLKGIAEGETIYSTRFIGDKLYMVTYRQVDPFFVVDLKNPKDIRMLGKLKIPGFSRYLHPYDQDTLIGIGRDTSSSGQQRGLKISLFDVSDIENPKEIAKFTTSSQYADSIAEYEHKAFLFNREKQLLVIPAYTYNYWGGSGNGFNGAMVFNVTKSEIKLRGVIDHSQNSQYYGPSVERSLFISELLYTKSAGLLRINRLSDLSKVKNVELDTSSSPYPIY